MTTMITESSLTLMQKIEMWRDQILCEMLLLLLNFKSFLFEKTHALLGHAISYEWRQGREGEQHFTYIIN